MTAPTLTGSVTLSIGSDSVTLPQPELGNTEVVDLGTLIKETATGAKLHGRPSEWQVGIQTFTMTFDGLSTSQRTLLDVILDQEGEEVTLTDHYGEVWSVIITERGPYSFTRDTLLSITLTMQGSPEQT